MLIKLIVSFCVTNILGLYYSINFLIFPLFRYGTVFLLCFGSSLFKVPPLKYPGSLLIGHLTHA